MFTGIIETIATIRAVIPEGTNLHFWLESSITDELKPDQSIAHNGVCLTVTEIKGAQYKVTAIAETLAKTTLAHWRTGDEINIERSLKTGDRLDGHFVQGHVDATATCIEKQTQQGSWIFRFRFPPSFAQLIIEKGSVCVNGVSLTAYNAGKDEFTVAIIPYTYQHTTFHSLDKGSMANIEFDIIGKYLLRRLQLAE